MSRYAYTEVKAKKGREKERKKGAWVGGGGQVSQWTVGFMGKLLDQLWNCLKVFWTGLEYWNTLWTGWTASTRSPHLYELCGPTKSVLSHLFFETVCMYTGPGDRIDNLELQEWCTGVGKQWVLHYVNAWLFIGKHWLYPFLCTIVVCQYLVFGCSE
jgi:hypothetical protein